MDIRPPIRNACILLVDDDRLITATLAAGLRDAGYDVLVADSSEAALDLLETAAPDLAVLDEALPGCSGLELAERLRERAALSFMFLSAYGDEARVQQATQSGALGYLVKPVTIAQLIPMVESALARAAEIRKLRETEQQLQAALNDARDINVAIGILMERANADRDAAFELLRSRARASRRKVADLARELIAASETLSLRN